MPADPPADVTRDVRMAACLDAPVLVVGAGERTRLEIARLIHDRSLRHRGPWVTVDGREATRMLAAAFAAAVGGTLFLPNVATLSPTQQGRLLCLLARAADAADTHAGPRVIAGTACDLRTQRFSPTLFYRLNVIRIDVSGPPPDARRRGGTDVEARRSAATGGALALRRVCAWCGLTLLDGEWHAAPLDAAAPVTHTICASCQAGFGEAASDGPAPTRPRL